jgi:Rrf2 family protein
VIFSKGCEYGVRAMAYLAARQSDDPCLVRDIAAQLNLPFSFLGKVVQMLRRSGLVNSYKGRRGGVSLARSADDITLLDVVGAIDGLNLSCACVLGPTNCSDDAPCPLHKYWTDIRERIVKMLTEQSLAEVARGLDDDRSMPAEGGASAGRPDLLLVQELARPDVG